MHINKIVELIGLNLSMNHEIVMNRVVGSTYFDFVVNYG